MRVCVCVCLCAKERERESIESWTMRRELSRKDRKRKHNDQNFLATLFLFDFWSKLFAQIFKLSFLFGSFKPIFSPFLFMFQLVQKRDQLKLKLKFFFVDLPNPFTMIDMYVKSKYSKNITKSKNRNGIFQVFYIKHFLGKKSVLICTCSKKTIRAISLMSEMIIWLI